MVNIIPDSEEIIKNLLQLASLKVSRSKDRVRLDLDDRGKVVFLHKKLKRAQISVPVRRKTRPNNTGRLSVEQTQKKKKIKIFPKKKTKKSS